MARKNIEIRNDLLEWFDTYHPGVSIWWLINEFMQELKDMSDRENMLKRQIYRSAKIVNKRME